MRKQKKGISALKTSFRIWDGKTGLLLKGITVYRLFFIAKNNIKKQKGDMFTFFILTLIASALIFISASFLVGTDKVVDTNMKTIPAITPIKVAKSKTIYLLSYYFCV